MTTPTVAGPPRVEDFAIPEGTPAILILKPYRSFCGQPMKAGDTLTAERLFVYRGEVTQSAALGYLRTLEERGVVKVIRPDVLPAAWKAVASMIAGFRKALRDYDTLNSEAMRLAEDRRTKPAREANEARLRADAERERATAERARVNAARLEAEAEATRQRDAERKAAQFEQARRDLAEGKAVAP